MGSSVWKIALEGVVIVFAFAMANEIHFDSIWFSLTQFIVFMVVIDLYSYIKNYGSKTSEDK